MAFAMHLFSCDWTYPKFELESAPQGLAHQVVDNITKGHIIFYRDGNTNSGLYEPGSYSDLIWRVIIVEPSVDSTRLYGKKASILKFF